MELEVIEQNKKLNIIAISDFTDYGDTAVYYGVTLANIFQSSLTIVNNFFLKNRKDKKRSFLQQNNFSTNFNQSLGKASDLAIETVLLEEKFTAKQLYQYAESTNSFMFVIAVSKDKKKSYFNRKKAFQFIKSSRLPVLVVGNRQFRENIFKNVVLPLDVERNAKEKAMWAGYFNRFNQANIHILFSIFKDTLLRQKVKDNLVFVQKLYENLNITYKEHSLKPAEDNIDLYSLKFSEQIGATLTVIMMTRYRTLIDVLIGVREKKLIPNVQQLPVLCLNERDDLYVLCT